MRIQYHKICLKILGPLTRLLKKSTDTIISSCFLVLLPTINRTMLPILPTFYPVLLLITSSGRPADQCFYSSIEILQEFQLESFRHVLHYSCAIEIPVKFVDEWSSVIIHFDIRNLSDQRDCCKYWESPLSKNKAARLTNSQAKMVKYLEYHGQLRPHGTQSRPGMSRRSASKVSNFASPLEPILGSSSSSKCSYLENNPVVSWPYWLANFVEIARRGWCPRNARNPKRRGYHWPLLYAYCFVCPYETLTFLLVSNYE